MALIELQHVSKTFQQNTMTVEALKDINLSVERADIYGIIGMSGAGKSTLIRCLNYLEKPTEGDVLIDGCSLKGLTPKELRKIRMKIGMIFQHFNLLMQKNVLDNVCFPLRLQKVKKKEAQEKARQLLKLVGLSEKEKTYPSQLSGGQKQRVAIARALASDPQILLCDEATSALDPQTTDSILKLLKKINEELGITIVIITHQMSVVQNICNRVAIIENGHLVENGTVEEIFNNPKSRAARELIFGDQQEELEKIEENQSSEGENLVRVVFTKNSAFEPVIADMILHFKTPVNILGAHTKNVGGVAKGEMLLELPGDRHLQVDMIAYLKEKGLCVQEVKDYV